MTPELANFITGALVGGVVLISLAAVVVALANLGVFLDERERTEANSPIKKTKISDYMEPYPVEEFAQMILREADDDYIDALIDLLSAAQDESDDKFLVESGVLQKLVADIESGVARTVSWEDMLRNLDEQDAEDDIENQLSHAV